MFDQLDLLLTGINITPRWDPSTANQTLVMDNRPDPARQRYFRANRNDPAHLLLGRTSPLNLSIVSNISPSSKQPIPRLYITMSDSPKNPWSGNPNAPHISEVLYLSEKSNFIGIFTGAIIYGTLTCACHFLQLARITDLSL